MLQNTQTTNGQSTQETSTSGKKPNLIAYDVRDVEGRDKAVWNPVGAVWFHKDGKGADLLLHEISLKGRIVLRERTEKPTS